ncbi:MAG TPA: inorganic diphosphatase [Polyangiales bacterium]
MQELEVVIDTPRGSFIKRNDDGKVDFVSPLPCPFNYGSVPNTTSGDGDRLDALVMGPSLPRGTSVRVPVRARVRFIDAGEGDPKYVCSARPLTARERTTVELFFRAYAYLKGALNLARGKRGATRYDGMDEPAP